MSEYSKTGYLTDSYKIFHIKDKEKIQFDFHYHDFHKILIHISGNVSYCIEGRSFLLMPGDIVLVGAGEVHRPVLLDDSTYERVIIYLSREYLENYQAEDSLSLCFDTALRQHTPVLRLGAIQEGLKNSINTLISTLSDTEYAKKLHQQLSLLEFLIQLNRAIIKDGFEYISSTASDDKLLRILDYINQNLTEDLTVDSIADKFYLSRYHLMHIFKAHTGYTLGSYISTKRLLLAREMINSSPSGHTIAEICYLCGFKSYSAFLRAYKKNFNENPTAHL